MDDFSRQAKLIALPVHKGFCVKRMDEITHLRSNGNYTWIYTEDGERYLSSKLLSTVLSKLNTPQFIRIHRSCAVNINHVSVNDIREFKELNIYNEIKVPVSQSHRKELRMRMSAR